MKIHLKALIFITLFALISISLLIFLNKNSSESQSSKINILSEIEKNGLIEFSVEDLNGRSFDIKTNMSEVLIINFWASWCAPCVAEIPDLIELSKKMKSKIKIIAINADNSDSEMKLFLKSYPEFSQDNIYIVSKFKNEMMEKFEVDKLPESFIFNKSKILKKKISGVIDWKAQTTIEYLNSINDLKASE